MNQPSPLKSLHSESSLIQLKLEQFRQLSTEELIESLEPGKVGALKTQTDGTIMDGHHRIIILRERGVDVDALPREIWERIN
ncbi:MAG: hypothetical protein LH614_15775 [Pyrinomonadaceae bacterium]|nr:hypothetical protein [Pyrinomonadaceae bacterium]